MDDDDFAEHEDGIDALLSGDVAIRTSPDNPPASSCADGWLVPARPKVQSKASRRSVLDFTKELYTADGSRLTGCALETCRSLGETLGVRDDMLATWSSYFFPASLVQAPGGSL
jgi:hypothetical protein